MNPPLPEALATALTNRRKAAAPGTNWEGVEDWVGRTYGLLRVGGTLSLVLPDGQPFTYRKPYPQGGGRA